MSLPRRAAGSGSRHGHIQHATDALMEIAHEHTLILDEQPVTVRVDAPADHSANLFCHSVFVSV